MKKIAALIASLMMAFAIVGVNTTPAHAGWPGGEVLHAADDSGFTGPITVYCNNGDVVRLGVGEWSKHNYGHGSCADVNYISVDANRQVVCFDRNGTRKVYYPGVRPVGDWDYLKCYHQYA